MFRTLLSGEGPTWRRMLRVTARASAGGTVVGGCGWYLYQEYQEQKLPPYDAALQPDKSLSCPLVEKEVLSATTARFRFGLPTPDHVLGLPLCSHIVAHDAGMMARAYTPVTLDRYDKGYFDLIIKKYDGGYFSAGIFHDLQIGETMTFRGPITTLPYQPNAVRCLCMVAGGTGITPMYQIIRTVLASTEEEDRTELRLLYANTSVDDIILKKELDALVAQYPHRFKVHYVIEHVEKQPQPQQQQQQQQQSKNNNDTKYKHNRKNISMGRIGASIVKDFLPPPTDQDIAILVCGPDGMIQFLCGEQPQPQNRIPQQTQPRPSGLLQSLGYGRQILLFSDVGGVRRPG